MKKLAGSKYGKIVLRVGILLLCFALMRVCTLYPWVKPSGADFKNYADTVYGKNFTLMEEFIRVGQSDGESPRRELFPSATLVDPECGVSFTVYAFRNMDEWCFDDNFCKNVLLYCIQQQGIALNEERTLPGSPCLVLDNSYETALKLQRMTIQFNELCCVNEKYRAIRGNADFCDEYTFFVRSVKCSYRRDEWPAQTTVFCFDTPVEKYLAYLQELEQYAQSKIYE